ncbi:hypothetical protein BC829DRAFT_382646 [Chytridium lagenaria]|nr:hypothetical protein BC829DRAFT_382646 [Chytridium lagenaria]
MGRNKKAPAAASAEKNTKKITLSERFATLRKLSTQQQQAPPKNNLHLKKAGVNQNQKKPSVLSRLGAQHVLKRLGAPVVPIQQRLGVKPGATIPRKAPISHISNVVAPPRLGQRAKGKSPRKGGRVQVKKPPASKETLDMELDTWRTAADNA